MGIFQGLTIEEMKERYPKDYETYKNSNPDYCVSQGESKQQRYNRSIECFDELAAKHIGETITIVTHGGVLNCLFRYVIGIGLEAPRYFKILNTSINIFTFNTGNWNLHTFGDVHHLLNLEALDNKE